MRGTSVKSSSSFVTSTTWQPSMGGDFSDVAPVAANLRPDRGASSSPEPQEQGDAAPAAGPALFQPPLPPRRSARIKKVAEKPKSSPVDVKARPPSKPIRRKKPAAAVKKNGRGRNTKNKAAVQSA